MNAEELKAAVRAYADKHTPGWRSVAVDIRIGERGEFEEHERLLVFPVTHPEVSRPQSRPRCD